MRPVTIYRRIIFPRMWQIIWPAYTNDVIFPGAIDVQTATLDDPDAIPIQAQIQTAERVNWMEDLGSLPSFERYPPIGPDAP